jgi:hypothetical protein
MDYRVLLANSVAQVTLEQQYENSTNLMLELEYLFPIDPSACVTEFKATFGESEIIGLVKDKKEAKGDYEMGLREGRQVAYGEINAKSRDIMCLKIGNVPPKTTVKLTISFMQTLEVSICSGTSASKPSSGHATSTTPLPCSQAPTHPETSPGPSKSN